MADLSAPQTLVMRLRDEITIAWMSRAALFSMSAQADLAFPLETGGVLLGYLSNKKQVVVTNSIGPGPRARHARDSFDPDNAFQEQEIARLYAQSGRRWSYLGDWHTHPRSSSKLSPQDKRTLRRIGHFRPARISTPVMAILGGGPTSEWSLAIWQAMPAVFASLTLRLKILRLKPIVFDSRALSLTDARKAAGRSEKSTRS